MAESTISWRLECVARDSRMGSARSTVSMNLRTASTAARWPSSTDFSTSRGTSAARPPVLLVRREPALLALVRAALAGALRLAAARFPVAPAAFRLAVAFALAVALVFLALALLRFALPWAFVSAISNRPFPHGSHLLKFAAG